MAQSGGRPNFVPGVIRAGVNRANKVAINTKGAVNSDVPNGFEREGA